MYSDIGPGNGGIKATKALVQAYEGAWAQSQGDQPEFPETDEEKVFRSSSSTGISSMRACSSARSFRISCDT
jgi:hypothetical protein